MNFFLIGLIFLSVYSELLTDNAFSAVSDLEKNVSNIVSHLGNTEKKCCSMEEQGQLINGLQTLLRKRHPRSLELSEKFISKTKRTFRLHTLIIAMSSVYKEEGKIEDGINFLSGLAEKNENRDLISATQIAISFLMRSDPLRYPKLKDVCQIMNNKLDSDFAFWVSRECVANLLARGQVKKAFEQSNIFLRQSRTNIELPGWKLAFAYLSRARVLLAMKRTKQAKSFVDYAHRSINSKFREKFPSLVANLFLLEAQIDFFSQTNQTDDKIKHAIELVEMNSPSMGLSKFDYYFTNGLVGCKKNKCTANQKFQNFCNGSLPRTQKVLCSYFFELCVHKRVNNNQKLISELKTLPSNFLVQLIGTTECGKLLE